MKHLAHRDTQAVVEFLGHAYSALDPDGFATESLRALLRLVPADRCSYSEFYRKRPTRSVIEPGGIEPGGQLWQALSRHGHENPILAHYRRTGGAPHVVTFSDVATRSELHHLTLYNEYYRHVDVEHQVIVPLTLSTAAHEIGFALSRRRSDFSGRDRRVLELVQPHLVQAQGNARAAARLRARQQWLEQAVESVGMGVIALRETGEIAFSTRQGRALLGEYFGASRANCDRLPDQLTRWVRHFDQAMAHTGSVPRPRLPLIVTRDGKRLAVRLVGADRQRMLLLEERHLKLDPGALAPLGLTERETEVLAWLAMGKTNDEIASIIGAKVRTIAKHLEHIYQKLGVETRTAAAVHALSAAGVALDSAPEDRAGRD